MAKNTNDGYRIGSVKIRTQVFNPQNNQYVKRDANTGKFLSSSSKKYKGVKLEKNYIY